MSIASDGRIGSTKQDYSLLITHSHPKNCIDETKLLVTHHSFLSFQNQHLRADHFPAHPPFEDAGGEAGLPAFHQRGQIEAAKKL